MATNLLIWETALEDKINNISLVNLTLILYTDPVGKALLVGYYPKCAVG